MINKSHRSEREAVDPDVIDSALEILRDRDRRYALYFLLEHDRASIREIGNVVTGWTKASSSEMGGKDDRDEIVVDFRHRHIPTMTESNVVDYDSSSDSLSLGPCPDAIRALIERACAEETGS